MAKKIYWLFNQLFLQAHVGIVAVIGEVLRLFLVGDAGGCSEELKLGFLGHIF